MIGSQGNTDTVTKSFCEPDTVDAIKVEGAEYPNLKDYMKKVYGASVDKFMCTDLCPCDETHKELFEFKEEPGFNFFTKENGDKQYRVTDALTATPALTVDE